MTTKRLVLLALCIMIAGCAGSVEPGQQLEGYLKECTVRFGYDPEAAAALGPHELGVGELQWRECAYQKVETDLIPKVFAKDLYRRLIAEDREMTARVAAGQLTRAERRARIQAALGEIYQVEEAEIGKRSQTVDNAMKDEMRREQARDMQRAMMVPLLR